MAVGGTDESKKYGLTLVIGTKKIMASTVVFVRVVRALKHSTSCDPQT
jgi:hypothetical protein